MGDDGRAREVGRIADAKGRVVVVGIDGGQVTLRTIIPLPNNKRDAVELSSYRAEEFAQLYISACWQAGWQSAQDGAP